MSQPVEPTATDIGNDGAFSGRLVAEFIKSCIDRDSGDVSFCRGGVPSTMALCYAVLGLEQRGALTDGCGTLLRKAVDAAKTDSVESLSGRILSDRHRPAYFVEEARAFVLQCRDALGIVPVVTPVDLNDDSTESAAGIIRFFESLPWDDPWRDSNRVMFALSRLAALIEHLGRDDLRAVVTSALDWLDDRQSPETGLWAAPRTVPLENRMAATFHFGAFYYWVGRPLRYPEKIIDSCLRLQGDHGLFSGPIAVGANCLDYDAIDLLAKATLITRHRRGEVESALLLARSALLNLQNSDGGFANQKWKIVPRWPIPGLRSIQRRAISQRSVRAVREILSRRVPSDGNYHVCLRELQCGQSDSNLFCTWFRSLAIDLCDAVLDPDRLRREGVTFRRLPFLGYHPFQ